MIFRLVTVYPDLLGTYGDAGNGIVLEQRLKRRGIAVEHSRVNSHEPIPQADLYVLGGGEDGPQALAAERLGNDVQFTDTVHHGAAVFAVCAGYQIMTRSFIVADGTSRPGLGFIPADTVRSGGPRAVGEIVVRCRDLWSPEETLMSGFENHSSHTRRDPGAMALGTVVTGTGNGEDGSEGVVVGAIVGTYMHGPALARNPDFADWLLELAGLEDLSPLNDEKAFDLRAERITSAGAKKASGPGGFVR